MLKDYLTGIADAIRSKLGTSGTLNAQSFADKISEVYDAGGRDGYDRFWDAFQENGKRTHYKHGFCGIGFTNETFKPKYDILAKNNGYMMFATTGITDLTNLDVKLDFSGLSSNCQYLFYESGIKRVGEVDLRGCDTLSLAFYGSYQLQTIEKLILKDDGSQTWNNTFNACNKLQNIVIEGVIGKGGLNMSSCPLLSHDSIVSVINALSGETSGLSVTLSLEAVNNAFETSEGAADGSSSDEWTTLVASKSNWTISLI